MSQVSPAPADDLQEALLAEAARIGDAVLEQGHRDDRGTYWLSVSLGDEDQTVRTPGVTLYAGGPGIALFLMRLARLTGRGRYLEGAESALTWASDYLKSARPADGFYSGAAGVAYALLELSRVSGRSAHLERALECARLCLVHSGGPRPAELLAGRAGTALGLLHLHTATGEAWLAREISGLIHGLKDDAHHGRAGVYWDRSQRQIRGLCGMSHGAAGVGFALLEAGWALSDDGALELGEEAFLYEAGCYDQRSRNWPDYRLPFDEEERDPKLERAYRAGEWWPLLAGKDVNVWCHGAAGIGLTRLRAVSITGREMYRSQADAALAKSRETLRARKRSDLTFTLCHGILGIAALFLESFRAVRDADGLAVARELAREALGSRREDGSYRSGFRVDVPDAGLMMGAAGIGHFFLEVAAPEIVPSVLAPYLPSRSRSAEAVVEAREGRRCLLGRAFGSTLAVADRACPAALERFLASPSVPGQGLRQRFGRWAEAAAGTVEGEPGRRLREALALDRLRQEIDDAVPSCALLGLRTRLPAPAIAEAAALQAPALKDLWLALAPDVRFFTLGASEEPAIGSGWTEGRRRGVLLLRPTPKGTDELSLEPLAEAVITSFRGGQQVGEVIAALGAALKADADPHAELETLVLAQVREALNSGVLVLIGIVPTDPQSPLL